jgi:hypothetical protein
MTPSLRTAGAPSPLADGTHDDADLRPAIPFDPSVAGDLIAGDVPVGQLDVFDLRDAVQLPGWLVSVTRMIRPICVGALMAIPTIGAATVGTVALFDGDAAMRAATASTAFLAGIPGDIVALIGVLATGYSLSKTVERLKGKRV